MADRKALDGALGRLVLLEQHLARRNPPRDPFPEMVRLLNELAMAKAQRRAPSPEAAEFYLWLRTHDVDR